MALVKVEELDTGITLEAAYYRVISVDLRPDEQSAAFIVQLYKDKEARLGGKLAINEINFKVYSDVYPTFFDISELDQEGNNVFSAAYTCMKAMQEFETAIDDLD